MKTGLAVTDMLKQVMTDHRENEDVLVPTSKISTGFSRDKFSLDINHADFDMTHAVDHHSTGQLSEYLDIPRRFSKHIISNHRDLASNTFNTLLRAKPEDDKRMIRLNRVGDVRGILSNSYKRIDNVAVLDGVFNALEKNSLSNQIEVKSANVWDSSLNLSIVFPKLETEIGLNDAVQFGFNLRNNEVGKGAVVLEPFAYRLVCLNGMICQVAMKDFVLRMTHLGSKADQIASEKTLKLEQAALESRIVDYIRDMASPNGFMQVAERMRQSNETAEVVKPFIAVEELAKSFELPKEESDSILERLIKADGGTTKMNLWGMANAVTNLANDDSVSYERGVELQEIGGKILTLDERQWRRIAEAA